jgi:hypothetical protein
VAYLNEEEYTESSEDGTTLIINSMNPDDMHGGAKRNKDHRTNRFEQIKLVTHIECEVRIEKGNGDDDEFDGHEVSKDMIDDFEYRPFFRLHQSPGTWGED